MTDRHKGRRLLNLLPSYSSRALPSHTDDAKPTLILAGSLLLILFLLLLLFLHSLSCHLCFIFPPFPLLLLCLFPFLCFSFPGLSLPLFRFSLLFLFYKSEETINDHAYSSSVLVKKKKKCTRGVLLYLSPSAACVPALYLLLPGETSCVGEPGAERYGGHRLMGNLSSTLSKKC